MSTHRSMWAVISIRDGVNEGWACVDGEPLIGDFMDPIRAKGRELAEQNPEATFILRHFAANVNDDERLGGDI